MVFYLYNTNTNTGTYFSTSDTNGVENGLIIPLSYVSPIAINICHQIATYTNIVIPKLEDNSCHACW